MSHGPYERLAFVVDVNTQERSVRLSGPSGPAAAPGAPNFSLVAGDVVELAASNYSASAVGAFLPGKIRVRFNISIANRLAGVQLITPTFPAPPPGTNGIVLFPYETSVTVTAGGTSVGGNGNDVVVEQPSNGSVSPSDDWAGVPFNFFNDNGCPAGSNDCYRHQVFNQPLMSGTISESRTVGFDIDPTVANFRARLIIAADIAPDLPNVVLSGNITADRTLTPDTQYVLSGQVKVRSGATLSILAGTKIVGDTTVPGSSLWISRGARIQAMGSQPRPIVFTSQRALGHRKPGDWGGIVIIGNGTINRSGGVAFTVGSSAGVAENYAGGTDNNDNSGTLRYVRIEFAGYDISHGAGENLSSLTSYAVGQGTRYEYIQSMMGLGKAFEWKGGAVDGRYLVSYESGDDHFSWTEGYSGRNQFLIGLQTMQLTPLAGAGFPSSDPRGFQGDGCDPAASGCTLSVTGAATPYSMPVFANFTMIGPGQLAGYPADGNGGTWRRGTGGTFMNGVLGRWKGIAFNVGDAWTDTLFTASGGKDSLQFSNILLAQNGFNFDTGSVGTANSYAQPGNWASDRLASLKVYGGEVLADTLVGIIVTPGMLDWTPRAGSPANSGGGSAPAARVAGFFGGTWANTIYLGAADPAGDKWWEGWTRYRVN
jgi:hypothetical protein